jgi:hypothetical protein
MVAAQIVAKQLRLLFRTLENLARERIAHNRVIKADRQFNRQCQRRQRQQHCQHPAQRCGDALTMNKARHIGSGERVVRAPIIPKSCSGEQRTSGSVLWENCRFLRASIFPRTASVVAAA